MKCRTLTSRLVLGAALGSLAACGEPNLPDANQPQNTTQSLSAQLPQLQAFGSEPPLPITAYVAHRDEEAGLPTFAWLTSETPVLPTSSPAEVAWRTLRGLPAEYKLGETVAATARLREIHDTHNGPVIASFDQYLDGKPVFGGRIAIGLDRFMQPMVAAGYLKPQLRVLSSQWSLGESGAADVALRALKLGFTTRSEPGKRSPVSTATLLPKGGLGDIVMTGPATSRAVYFPTKKGLLPAYHVELDVSRPGSSDGHMYAFVVSATDGEILFAHDLTANDSYTYKVFADDTGDVRPWDSPHGNDFTPHPTGMRDGSEPTTLLTPKSVKLQNAPFSKNDPWLPSGATEASGNNVWAYADISSPDGYNTGDVNLITSSTGSFEYPIDVSMDPAKDNDSRRAVTTQLFYVINYMHDYFYDAGWTEAALNPQKSNYGRGGSENDAIKGESQDSSGRNNANASTPADGRSPRIQMYLFDNNSTVAKVTAPTDLVGKLKTASADFGPSKYAVSGDVVLADDDVMGMGTPAGTVSDGCETPWKNAAAVAGKIAIIDRGFCAFVQKVKNAQTAGAIGAIILNNVAGEGPRGMSGTDPTITIPAIGLSKEDGDKIKTKLMTGAVSVSFSAQIIVRDGALDTAIVSHEWGHVLSNRLIGNSVGLTSAQGAGMGEGWSDFVALLTIVRPEDAMVAANADWKGVYATGSHALAAPGNDAFYDGIRRYPYSTDMTKNPLTFKMIEDGVLLPTMPAPVFGADGSSNSEVHNTGEVWAAMLWECYAALLKDTARYTFDQANRRMREYLVAALKLTPTSPTVLEARDALLAAARAQDIKDFGLFFEAFAKRGAGLGAVGPARTATGNHSVTESYDAGADLQILGITLDPPSNDCDKDGVLDPGETAKLRVKVRNTGAKALGSPTLTVTAEGPNAALIKVKGSPAKGAKIDPLSNGELSLDIELSAATKGITPFDLKINITDAALAMGKTYDVIYEGLGAYDDLPESSLTDGFDSPYANPRLDWTPVSIMGPDLDATEPFQRYVRRSSGIWHGFDTAVPADNQLISPPIQLATTGPFTLTIKHRYDFEQSMMQNFDGGVIEISEDDGMTWKDVGGLIKMGGYVGTIETNARNPLSARTAFVGRSPSYGDAAKPGYTSTLIELGDAYKGKAIRLRFRIGTDDAEGALGWDIDEIVWTGLHGTPYPSRVNNLPPLRGCGTWKR